MAYTYQWIDGDDGTDIVGETSNSILWVADLNNPPKLRITNTVTGQVKVVNPPVITVTPTSTWILADGTWDDTGFWDDSATWSDT